MQHDFQCERGHTKKREECTKSVNGDTHAESVNGEHTSMRLIAHNK